MLNEIILTICIMSYNRKNSLVKQLEYFEKNYNKKIELIVIDNCSSDDSKEVLCEYNDRLNNFSFVINENNIGCDGSIKKSIDFCKGKYVIFLGDDMFVDGVFNKVVDALEEYDPAIMHISNNNKGHLFELYNLSKKEISKLIKKELSYYMFMSSNIYRKDILLRYKDNINLEYATTLFYSIACLSEGNLLVLNDKVIFQDYDNLSWTSKTNEVWFKNIPTIFHYFRHNGFSKKDISIMKNRNYGYFLFCSFKRLFKTISFVKKQCLLFDVLNIKSISFFVLFSLKKILRKKIY